MTARNLALRFVPIAAVAVLAACGTTTESRTQPTQSATLASQSGAAGSSAACVCPMHLDGVTVSTTDTPAGVAVAFTTTGSNLAALQESVRRMADRHNSCVAPAAGAATGAAPAGKAGCPMGAAGTGVGANCAGHQKKGGDCVMGGATKTATMNCPMGGTGHQNMGANCPMGKGQGTGKAECAGHGKGAGAGCVGCCSPGAGGCVPSKASVETMEGGIRLVLEPRDPAQLDALRTHLRTCFEKRAAGGTAK